MYGPPDASGGWGPHGMGGHLPNPSIPPGTHRHCPRWRGLSRPAGHFFPPICLLRRHAPYWGETLPPLPWVFQQDNAPVHTSGVVKEYLASRKATVLAWPAMSPDLSPIENLWNYVSRQVYKSTYPTLDALWVAVQREWNAVPASLLADLYDSMPARCEAVIKSKGYPVNY